ncbi:MAG TPA: phosphotransferase family protein [Solirubrobacterales bacterium]|nr:phosphotransferase family protein [Solirubrobacterales bacterium]
MREPELEPLLVMEPLAAFLDAAGLGSGEIEASELGDGHSNVTFLLRRGGERLVLRRPPRGPLPPSAHDVLREARLLRALEPLGLPVPAVLAVCGDESVIGAPFYVMPYIEGHVLSDTLPAGFGEIAPERIGEELVDTLVRLHEIDFEAAGLGSFGRSDGYLERQLKRFNGLLEVNATRPLPDLERVGEWLAANLPESPATTLVHGDYRLGNVMFAPAQPQLVAVLDWEMATIGDPLADVGYMTAMWSEAEDSPNPVGDLSQLTRLPGFQSREQLIQRYAGATSYATDGLPWYQALALWKAAIFLEGSFKRYQAGTTADPYFARLSKGVEGLALLARKRACAA